MLALILLIRVTYVAVEEPRNLTRPAYILKGIVIDHPAGGAPLPPEPLPHWASALPAANLKAGQRLSQQCVGCHDLSTARKNQIGPALFGILGRPRASVSNFAYSGALRRNHDPWTLDELFEFLRNPQLYAPGTSMGFAGFQAAQQRIDLIAYLRVTADDVKH